MQTSKYFAQVVRAACVALLVVVLLFGLGDIIGLLHSPNHVSAQNAGVVGIQATLVPVFTNQNSVKSSSIFQDIGQGVNILRYCTTNFVGTINLEWSPTKAAPFYALATSTFSSADAGCHSIGFTGYFPNVRSTVTPSTGSVSAWYSASSGPSGPAAAVGSSGATSPIACDHQAFFSLGASTTAPLVNGIAGTSIYVCQFTISFEGATSTGFISLGNAAIGAGCTGYTENWNAAITANSAQFFQVGGPLGAFVQEPAGLKLCAAAGANTSIALISYSWAQL